MPADVKLTPIDRSVGANTVVDEFIFEFTHNVPMDWMLPGVKPTGKKVRVPFVVVVKFVGDKVRKSLAGAAAPHM
jgi:carboxymethylenebutenolidase